MFMPSEMAFISIDDELAALLADFEAFVGDDGAPAEESSDPADDQGPVLDPLLTDDGAVFGESTTPTVTDGDVLPGVDETPTTALEPGEVTDADAPFTFDLDALVETGDAAYDPDPGMLLIGRRFDSLDFSDLP